MSVGGGSMLDDDARRRRELAEFLRSRRESARPTDHGLPGGRRRGRGLRREELAVLAGVSPSWYTYLEQGRDIRPSAEVISSLARVLGLTEVERDHLLLLASRRSDAKPTGLSAKDPGLQTLLDHYDPWPAYVTGPLADIQCWNSAAAYWYTDFAQMPMGRNLLLWILTDDEAKARLVDWEDEARDIVARVRGATATLLPDPDVAAAIDGLRAASPLMRTLWSEQQVAGPARRTRRLRHPAAGRCDFDLHVFHWSSEPLVRLGLHVPLPEITAG